MLRWNNLEINLSRHLSTIGWTIPGDSLGNAHTVRVDGDTEVLINNLYFMGVSFFIIKIQGDLLIFPIFFNQS